MSAALAGTSAEVFAPASSPLAFKKPAVRSLFWWRALCFVPKFAWGMLFCQTFIGGIIVAGWSYRLAQRVALKYWWKQSRRRDEGESFADFLGANESNRAHLHWPNWFFTQNFRSSLRRGDTGITAYLWQFMKALTEGVRANFWTGVRAVLTTWLLTLPACFFWWFGWYDGWNNSFAKGYEHAGVGPIISWAGIFMFIAAMFYVPMAQARQACTGDWRSFFQFRLVWQVARKRWFSCAGLAVLYVLVALPIAILKTTPIFAPNAKAAMETWSNAQVLSYLNRYFFFCAMFVFPAYVLVRVVAARIYASGLLAAVKSGRVRMLDLAENERDTLWRLDLLHVQAPKRRHFVVRFLAWAGTRTGGFVGGFLLMWLWFAFVASIYIAEFFNYHQGFGWVNHPFVQVPWFRYIPPSIQNPAFEIASSLALIGIAFGIRSLWRKLRAPK